jgi:carboxyl-terminal processing protease
MVDLYRKEYAYTEAKGLDWDALQARYRPQFEAADETHDTVAYADALRDFHLNIPDGHMRFPILPQHTEEWRAQTDGGLGIAIRELDDGRVIVNYLGAGMPADQAGIELGAEILGINSTPIDEAISATSAWGAAPFSTEHFKRLQQLRYVTRFSLGADVKLTYKNPGESEPETAFLTAVAEQDNFAFSSFNVGLTQYELPVEYRVLDQGYVYVKSTVCRQ